MTQVKKAEQTPTVREEPRTITLPTQITVSLDTLLWVLLGAAAVLTRLWDLGARAMSHDESLHVYYSWWLSIGNGYQHNPMMHGPFLFEATGLLNLFFGANDFISRLVPAFMGIGIVVGIPYLLRHWLGRWGSLATSCFFLISPFVLYYSRYNRHDLQVVFWVLLAVWAMLSYLRSRQDFHLALLAGFLGLMFATMEITFIYLAIFASFLIVKMLAQIGFHWKEIRQSAEWDLLVVLATLGALFSSPIALLVLNPIWNAVSGQPLVDLAVLTVQDASWADGLYGGRLYLLLAAFWVAAAAIGVWWGRERWLKLAAIFLGITIPLFSTIFTNKDGFSTGFIGSLGYWLSQHEVARGSQPLYYFLIVFPLYEYLPIVGMIGAAVFYAIRRGLSALSRDFAPMVLWWALAIFVGLSVAGEKMPWHTTHITVPFILLAGWFVGQLLEGGLNPAGHPFEERRSWGRWALLAVIALLAVLTVRTSYLVNYVNYDYTTEMVGYAHGAPGVKWTAEDVDRIASMTGMGKDLKVAHDDEIAWPMSWYFRNYPGFFGKTPSRENLADAAVVVVSQSNWEKVERILGNEYNRYEVIRMWWPIEDYRNLTWERIRYALTNPDMRQALWQIAWNRDYSLYASLTQQAIDPPAQWPLEDRMRIYIRKDIAGRVPGLQLAVHQLPDLEPFVDIYAPLQIQPDPVQVIQPAGLNAPRNLAFGPDGSVYLADSGNDRILKLDAQGNILAQWGSRSPKDQNPPPPGTFWEPWGIAVDSQGFVYVADTWNHRIQKFDPNGEFVKEWGKGCLRSDGADCFWGPRAIAIGPEGNLYVTDTGNKRIGVFDLEGNHRFDFSMEGEAALDEPVGLALGPDGNVYVADTWNSRVDVFSPDGSYLRSWAFEGWNSDSVDNKPYITLDGRGTVYLTDPENFRVVAFTLDGIPLAEFGELGAEENAFTIPNGIAVDGEGRVWVVDAGNNRVAVYPPVEQ